MVAPAVPTSMASDIAGLCASLQNIFVELSQRITSRDEVARQQLYREGRGLLDDLEKRCASGAGCTPTATGAKPRTLQDWVEAQRDSQSKVKKEDDDDASTVVFSRDDDTSHGSSPDEACNPLKPTCPTPARKIAPLKTSKSKASVCSAVCSAIATPTKEALLLPRSTISSGVGSLLSSGVAREAPSAIPPATQQKLAFPKNFQWVSKEDINFQTLIEVGARKRGTAEKSPQDYNYWEDRSLPQVGTSSDLETYLKREGKSRGVKLPDMNKYQRKEFMALYGIIVQQDLSLLNKKGLDKFVAKLKEDRDSESRTRQALA